MSRPQEVNIKTKLEKLTLFSNLGLTLADLSVHVFAKTLPWTTFFFSIVAHVSRSSQVLVDIVKSSFTLHFLTFIILFYWNMSD